jgi:hypothetical protein
MDTSVRLCHWLGSSPPSFPLTHQGQAASRVPPMLGLARGDSSHDGVAIELLLALVGALFSTSVMRQPRSLVRLIPNAAGVEHSRRKPSGAASPALWASLCSAAISSSSIHEEPSGRLLQLCGLRSAASRSAAAPSTTSHRGVWPGARARGFSKSMTTSLCRPLHSPSHLQLGGPASAWRGR